jgi:YesN/AraC family two-component response regulator
MDDYIAKPLNVKQLSETIARVMSSLPAAGENSGDPAKSPGPERIASKVTERGQR